MGLLCEKMRSETEPLKMMLLRAHFDSKREKKCNQVARRRAFTL